MQSRTWPRDPGTQPATVSVEKCPAHCISHSSLLRCRASCWFWQHPSRPPRLRSPICYRLQLCAAKKLKSLGLVHSYFVSLDGGLCTTEWAGQCPKIICCTLHFLLKYEHEPFFINGSFINSWLTRKIRCCFYVTQCQCNNDLCFSVKQEDCGLDFPSDFKADVADLKLDGNCDFGSGKW